MQKWAARVAGAGLLALDVVVQAEGEPGALTYAGGTCGNVLSILSYLKWNSEAVGFLGDDVAGRLVHDDLTSTGVHSRHLLHRADRNTPVFVQKLQTDAAGMPKHSFSTQCPACGSPIGKKYRQGSFSTTPIRNFSSSDAPDVFFMDRLSDDILALAQSAKTRGASIFYEPSVKTDLAFWEEAFAIIDIVKYSADRFDEDELGRYTHQSRPLWEVQTLGAKGLKYRRHSDNRNERSEWMLSPAITAPRVVDTCGAGDWCSAGLLHGLSSTGKDYGIESFGAALRLGQTLAAWACGFVGARGAMYVSNSTETWAVIHALSDGRTIDMTRWPATRARSSSNDGPVSAASCAVGLCDEN